MTTVADWVDETRAYLEGGQSPVMNVLDGAYTPGDPSLTFEYDLNDITAGRTISIGLANFVVLSTNPSSKTAQVRAGWMGADDVACADNDVALVNPRYPTHRIVAMLNRVLLEMSGKGLYAVDDFEIDVDPTQDVYSLDAASGLLDILNITVAQDNEDLTDRRPTLPEGSWAFRRIAPTTEFPAGTQVRFFDIDYANDAIATITYKRTFAPVSALDDDVADTLIGDGMEDIPPLGAAAKLAGPQEMRRNQLTAQGDTRRAEEVPPGAVLSGARELRRMYQERMMDEVGRLLQAYPPSYRS